MRTRKNYHKRRITCLVLLCIWSLATMFFLWKQIIEKEGSELTRVGRKRHTDVLTVKYETQEIINKISTRSTQKHVEETLEPLQVIMKQLQNSKLPIKLRHRKKNKIDYGGDRDIDVEGVNDYMMWYENFQNTFPHLPTLSRQQKCTSPIQNVAFLKTHFTGSDVITNILNRFGDLNNLNVALPGDGLSTFFWPMRFQWKYIDITLLNGSLPNIISNHARYNNDVMDNILNPGSVYVTILRDPVSQLETTFNNLGFGGLLQVTNTTDQIKTFLQNPKFYIQGVVRRKRFKDTLNLIKNGQFFDLGLPTTEYHRKNIIKTTIQELYEKFSVVMIYEHLDESLVLMKRRLCWQLDDILYLKFHHTNQNIWNRKIVPSDVAALIRKWNSADATLYEFFNNTLWQEIGYEGKAFWDELKEFRDQLNVIESDCLSGQSIDDKFVLEEVPTERPQGGEMTTNKIQNRFETSPSKLLHLNQNVKYVPDRDQRSLLDSNWTDRYYSFQQKSLKEIFMMFNSDTNKQLVKSDYAANENNTQSPVINRAKTFSLSNPEAIEHSEIPHNKLLSNELLSVNDVGSGGYEKEKEKEPSNTERMLSSKASRWNTYFCKKLLMSELEYLDYFRRKHSYAKAEIRNKNSKRK